MPDPLVLTGATLIDGTGAAPVSGRAVVVRDGRIHAVVAERDAPSGKTLRLDDLTLLPGLINCHVHLCFGGEADPGTAMVKEAFAATVIKATLRARQTVEAGVTTVRDLGSIGRIKALVDGTAVLGPPTPTPRRRSSPPGSERGQPRPCARVKWWSPKPADATT